MKYLVRKSDGLIVLRGDITDNGKFYIKDSVVYPYKIDDFILRELDFRGLYIDKAYKYDGQNIIVANQNIIDNYLKEQFNELKQDKLDRLVIETTNYIENYYSGLKQRSDIADKEYWGAWLITHFSNTYTTDNLYQKFFNSAAKIIEGVSDFDTEVNNLKEVTAFIDSDKEAKYPIALEQLLKVAIRQGWVQSCKVEYKLKTQLISNATTIEDLQAIKLNFREYPLK
jgi:hypothetical protein